jgi:hypothetical protein
MGAQSRAKSARRALRLVSSQAEMEPWLAPWTPFQEATPYLSPEKRSALIEDVIRTAADRGMDLPRERAVEIVDQNQDAECWVNSRYTVLVFRDEPSWHEGAAEVIHLSIRRNDRQCPREERWRDFQRVKNELVGEANEGVELYPSDDRVADCANQFHIYVLKDPESEFPFGFRSGFRAGPSVNSPAVQRPFEDS